MPLGDHLKPKQSNPQWEKADPRQVRNEAGGFSFQVTPWTRLERFLVLGSSGGTYYATERTLTIENAECVKECLNLDYKRTIDAIVKISTEGRAIKQEPVILALAIVCSHKNPEISKYGLAQLQAVCRTATHLFQFAEAISSLRGWGPSLRKAIAAWYNRPVSKVDYQIIKYRHRAGWTHRDLLRLAHVRPASPEHSALFRWIINHEGKTQQTEVHALFEELTGTRYTINDLVELLIAKLQLAKRLEHKPKYVQQAATKLLKDVNRAVNFGHLTYSGTDQVIIVKDKANCIYCKNPKSQLIQAVNDLEETNSVNDIAFIVSKFKLPREAVESKNTELLNERKIWEALLPDMPMTALIRNLGQMSAKEFLVKNSPESKYVIEQLREDKIKAARIHPISLLSAYKVYEQSHGMRGKLIWTADADIVEALEEGFYKAFQNVEPTGRNRLLALDISGSMYGSMVAGIPGLDAGTTAAAIALVTINVEPHVTLKAFAHELIDLELSKKEKIHRVVAKMQNIPMGGTDCALPILWALKNHSQQDSFETFTDSETWSGRTHPHQALKQYRAAYNPQAKFVVVGMCSNEFTIADPNDAGSLDIVGCDPNTPRVIADFVKGESWLN